MKYKYEQGFTLVEVMVALVVVAIVSTSLLQMFVTTSYVNKDAQLTDLANIIAVRQAEIFKADPDLANNYNNYSKTEYYDSLGKAPLPAQQSGVPAGAVIQVDSTVKRKDLSKNSSDVYSPTSFVGTIDLSPTTDLDVQITDSNEIRYGPHGSELASLPDQDSSKIINNNIMPIQAIFPGGSSSCGKIYLTNYSKVEADIYVFGAPPASSDPSILQPVLGSSSITFVPSITVSQNSQFTLQLTVSRLTGGSSQFMFTYSTDRYQ